MKILDSDKIKKLSFPDFEVENMEFSPQEKRLRICVAGAWLDIADGILLGEGTLFFDAWENLLITRFDPITEKWSNIMEGDFSFESLKDICEVKVFDSTIFLCGFGRKSGKWMEWKIINARMHAEFNNG
jgi:hypothetical protein